MKKISKSQIVAAAAIALGLSAVGTGVIQAAANNNSTKPMNGLVTAIAQKFNLNPTDVQAVVDSQRMQMKAEHQQKEAQMLADRLKQAVANQKLTQAQADLITAKQQELENFEASLTGKTPEERATAMKSQFASLGQWASANNIPKEYLLFNLHFAGGPGRKASFGFKGVLDKQGWSKVDPTITK